MLTEQWGPWEHSEHRSRIKKSIGTHVLPHILQPGTPRWTGSVGVRIELGVVILRPIVDVHDDSAEPTTEVEWNTVVRAVLSPTEIGQWLTVGVTSKPHPSELQGSISVPSTEDVLSSPTPAIAFLDILVIEGPRSR